MKATYAILLMIVLTGCDRYYGLSRHINTDYIVDHQCIRDALSSVGDIHDIEHKQEEGGIPITITGLQAPDKLHYYFYKTGDLNGYIYTRTNYEKKTEIIQSYGALHVTPPQKDINKIHPVMVKIESAIKDKCGIKNIETLIKETCSGVTCG